MYIPKTKSEICDLLGSMVLGCPEYRSSIPTSDHGLELSFEGLNESIALIYKDPEHPIRQQLLRMSKEAKRLSEDALDLPDGEKRNGHILYASQIFVDMQRLMKGKELLNYKED